MLPASAGGVKTDAQYRIAVLVAAVCSFLGYAIAGRSGALTWTAVTGLVLYIGGWFASQYVRAEVERSQSEPVKLLRKIRTAVLIITGFAAVGCLVILLRRAAPETAIASAVFLAGAFAAGQSFALFERSDLSGSLLITAPGAIVGAASRSPLPVVIFIAIVWLAAVAVALTLFHASELQSRLEHSEPAVEQEGRDWWPSLFAKILPVIAVIALLIALLSPLLTFELPKFERETPTIGKPPQGRDRTPQPGGTASPSRTPGADDGSDSGNGGAGGGSGNPDSGGGAGGSGGAGGRGDDSGAAGDHAGGEPGQEARGPGDDPGQEPGGSGDDPGQEPGGSGDDPNQGNGSNGETPGGSSPDGSTPGGAEPGNSGDSGDSGSSGGGATGRTPASPTSPRPRTPSIAPQITATPSPSSQQGEEFEPSLSLPSGEIRSDDTPVMRIKAPFPWYWRGVVFDTYTNGTWQPGGGEARKLKWGDVPEEDGSSGYGGSFEGRVSVFNTRSSAIFTTYRTESLSFDGPSPPAISIRPDMVISSSRPANDITYTVKALIPDSNPDVLRDADGKAPPGFERYLQVPDSISPRVFELAAEITKGRDGRYEKAVAVIEYLRSQSSSAERVEPPPEGVDPIEHYLFEGGYVGFSNHLASATAILLRANGIETRVVSGYVPRNPADPDGFLIRRSDAYDWVEVYFPGSGWVTFDAGLGALKPDVHISGWQQFVRWLKKNWFWLLAIAIVAVLIAAAGLRALRRRVAQTPARTEAQDLLTRLERAARYGRLAPQTPFEYARALRWKLLPDDGARAESVLALIAEAAYSGRPMTPEQRQEALVAVERIRHNESRRRGEDDQAG
ncbi:MAG: hypothetical protein DCC49_05450 [Acidobacteria bacterium]|nr:MAG: hypothetical protein DCC49_05450 [Acidobacteriota bacterium]